MPGKDCIAMILAGGRGRRMGALTSKMPKEAVPFCPGSHIIDFPLSNCVKSGIATIGILSQYNADTLHSYIDSLPRADTTKGPNIIKLPSTGNGGMYNGTADAVFKNFPFIEGEGAEDVLILTGDQVYSMDYQKMLDYHRENHAEMTLAVHPAHPAAGCQYGAVSVDRMMSINSYRQKVSGSLDVLASMGVSIIKMKILKEALESDNLSSVSNHDFIRHVIPGLVSHNRRILAYYCDDYWKDAGTVPGLWQANMDILSSSSALEFINKHIKESPFRKGSLVKIEEGPGICNSIVSDQSETNGYIENAVISEGVTIGEGAIIADSVVMPGVMIGDNAIICNAIIGPRSEIMKGVYIGSEIGLDEFIDYSVCTNGITLIAPDTVIDTGVYIQANSNVDSPFVTYGCM